MPYQFTKDRKTVLVSNGGVTVSSGATSFGVAGSAVADFPTGPRVFEVVSTGESILVTAGFGTTTWSGITRGINGTTSANIPDTSVLLETVGANEFASFVQQGDAALTNVRSIKKTGSAALTGDVTLTGGANVTLTQTGQDIAIAASGGSSVSDATTSAAGVVEVDHAPSGAHPVALTTDGVAVPSGMLGTASTKAAAGNDFRLSDTRTPTAGSVVDASVSASAAIAESKLNLASDAAAGTASRRTLGTGATQATAGNDARLSDTRTPTDGSVTTAKIVDGAVTTAKIADSGVTAATYGDATHVPVITFDAKGRATSASSTAITGSSPLTTKGDLYTHSTVDARFPVGADNSSLTPDSTQPTGLAWKSPTLAAAYDYSIGGSPSYRIGIGFSSDGRSFSRQVEPAISSGSGFESTFVSDPNLVQVGGVLYLYYAGYNGSVTAIGLARSFDGGLTWTKYAGNPILTQTQSWETTGGVSQVRFPAVLYDIKEPDSTKRWKMWYMGGNTGAGGIGYAYSSDGLSWTKYTSNPVLAPSSGWESSWLYPGAIVRLENRYYLFYNGSDTSHWKIGAATFTDPQGTYTKSAGNPILSPDGVEQSLGASVAIGDQTLTVADATAFPIGMPVIVNADTGAHYVSTVIAQPSSTTVKLADASPIAITSTHGQIWSAAKSSVTLSSALFDGGWRFGFTSFFPTADKPTSVGTLEVGMLAYGDANLARVAIDYSAGLVLKPTLTESQNTTQMSLENPAIVSLIDTPQRHLGLDPVELAALGATQSANTVLAGPSSGGAALMAPRTLAAADIPDLSSLYTPAGTSTGGDHLHGLARWAAAGGTTFDAPDVIEYLEMVYDNGLAVDSATVSLSTDRTQLVFDSAPTAGHVLQATYVLARI